MTQGYFFTRVRQELLPASTSPLVFSNSPLPLENNLGTLEVVDQDSNRQLNGEDRYIYWDRQGLRYNLTPELGIKLLKYFTDPSALRERRRALLIQNIPPAFCTPASFSITVRDWERIEELENESSDIDSPHLFWSNSASIDLDLLAGLRTFTSDEIAQYTSLLHSNHTMRELLTWNFTLNRVAIRTGIFAGIFLAGERALRSAGSAFMWEMYASNFLLSMVSGSVQEGRAQRSQEAQDLLLARQRTLDNTHRQNLNLRIGENRLHQAEDHLYWGLTWPVVALACGIDPNFRNFIRQPYRIISETLRSRYSGTRTSLVGGGAFAAGTLLLSSAAIYGVTSTWFDFMSGGNLPQGSLGNHIASGISTLLTETALLTRVSTELGFLVESGTLSWGNLSALQASEISWTGLFRGVPYLAEGAESASLVYPVGLAALAFSVGAGIGIGIDYAFGVFDEDFTPGDMVQEWRAWLKNL